MDRAEFEKKYVQLRQRSPGHPLMPVIAKGYSPLSCEYLIIALSDNVEGYEQKPSNESLFNRQGSLYSQRAVLSNRLYDCISDVQRADISLQIGELQMQIIRVKRDIAIFKKTGRIPLHKSKEKFIPEDGRSRERKLRSTRTMISQTKKLLNTELNAESRTKYEQRLSDLRAYAGELS